MFTETKIVLSEDLNIRGYVTFYFNGKRYREYNAKKLNLEINPNLCKSYKDRHKFFKKLAFEFNKALDLGWSPEVSIVPTKQTPKTTLRYALECINENKQKSALSSTYKRDLKSVLEKFIKFMPLELLNMDVRDAGGIDIEPFLNTFKSSATYYMNKRKIVNVYFTELHRKKLIADNPIAITRTLKKVAKLHQIYNKEQLNNVLNYLKEHYPNLHICCLLAYGCFLRPHHETRLLQRKHINDDFTLITLSGSENKSRRVRVANIPNYVKEMLIERLHNITDPNTNILSMNEKCFNVSYLNTQWSRAKKKMIVAGLIQKDQTIYSFRHTASVNVYKKTKDLHVLQNLLQHSNMIVTLNYLRGLGEINDETLKDVLPEL